MTIIDYAATWAAMVAIAWAFDTFIWLRYLRPLLASSYGWPEVQPDERIPMAAAACGAAIVVLLLVVLPWVGVSAGY